MNYFADLHCHTHCSDGSLSPEQLIEHAKEIGLKGLSITDHDNIDAYQTAAAAAKKAGLLLGTGVEFSCEFQGISLHLLGYDFDLENRGVQQLCDRHRKRRDLRNTAILDKLSQQGMPIAYEELLSKAQGKTIGRPHIALLMLEKGYVKNMREAFNHYIGEGKKCYVQGEPFQVAEAIEVLHAAGGKAFVAHPQLLSEEFPVDALLKLPLDGLECYYSRLFKKSWLEMAQSKGWLMSGGSDFHGSVKPEIELGCSGVDEATFHRIFEKI
ncbi:MAG: PHP domain-containing protein [Verrucomicrobia bacterium]|nr:PHP domain-containing protein [Verrucomicrobiota bacterium]